MTAIKFFILHRTDTTKQTVKIICVNIPRNQYIVLIQNHFFNGGFHGNRPINLVTLGIKNVDWIWSNSTSSIWCNNATIYVYLKMLRTNYGDRHKSRLGEDENERWYLTKRSIVHQRDDEVIAQNCWLASFLSQFLRWMGSG